MDIRTAINLFEHAPPPPVRKHLLAAIAHADIYGDAKWKLSQFDLKYVGFLSVEEIAHYDDVHGWMDVQQPSDLANFRDGDFYFPPGERMPPVILITAPDGEADSSSRLHNGKVAGGCMTQIGDGRGRINYANAHKERLHVYHMIFKGCGEQV
jgi:hypothetical protein